MDLDTILVDSAYQVTRAAPADERAGDDWLEPGNEWFASFLQTVKMQVEAELEKEGTECPCCGICP